MSTSSARQRDLIKIEPTGAGYEVTLKFRYNRDRGNGELLVYGFGGGQPVHKNDGWIGLADLFAQGLTVAHAEIGKREIERDTRLTHDNEVDEEPTP